MTSLWRAALVTLMLAAAVLATGCSAPPGRVGEQVVFAVPTGFGQGIRATTVDMVDMGLPDLRNLTGQSVRLGAVTLMSVPKAVHVRSVTAYPYPRSGGLGLGHGDLLRLCRKIDRPHPLTDAVMPPHADSNWLVVIAFTIAKPGRYYLGRAKIYYITSGRRGWQFQNLFATIVVAAAPPGTQPRFDGCL